MAAMFGQGFDSPRLHKKDLIQLNEVFLFRTCWQLIIQYHVLLPPFALGSQKSDIHSNERFCCINGRNFFYPGKKN